MNPDFFPLPLQGMPERRHLYEWIELEEEYVRKKFEGQRAAHDAALTEGIEPFWVPQVVQYYDRARLFLDPTGPRDPQLDAAGLQALAKAMMTAKGLVESAIRIYGQLPRPGLPSGYLQEWDDRAHPGIYKRKFTKEIHE